MSSAVDVYQVDDGEVFSAPVDIPAWLRRGRPRFFSRPGAVVHNSAENKVSFLRMHYPEIFAPDAVTVGISDNNYGEDRTWPDHFDHVVALNSRHPFSPFVRVMSPCKTIQTVDATPVAGSGKRERGFDWHGTLQAGVLDSDQLGRRFSEAEHNRLEALVDQLRSARERVAAGADGSLRRSVAAVGASLVETVERYNHASSQQKPTIARELHRMAASMRRVQGKLEKMRRSCARIYHELELLHDRIARAVACRQN